MDINVPDIGLDEMEVTEILVKIGDIVQPEQSIITVEGEKTAIEIPSPKKGKVEDIKINVGDKISTGKLIMIFSKIEKNQEKIQDTNSKITPNKKNINNNLNNKKNITQIKSNNTNDIALTVHKKNSFSKINQSVTEQFVDNESYSHATTVVRRLAREFGINLTNIKGTGRNGRILREDIRFYIQSAIINMEQKNNSKLQNNNIYKVNNIDFSKFGNVEEVEISKIRKISGNNLQRNWSIIPHVTQFEEADITELDFFRRQKNKEQQELKKSKINLTILSFIIKAIASALEKFPFFNSSLSLNNNKIILKKYINIGVAVETSNGLVVPILKEVNKKRILELAENLVYISVKARTGKLVTSDIQGGSFTVSSLGSLGGLAFTPIINAPEVAILGISKSSIKPLWTGKEFVPRLMLPLSLSYDHRVIDGVDGVRFISYIKYLLSDIRQLLM